MPVCVTCSRIAEIGKPCAHCGTVNALPSIRNTGHLHDLCRTDKTGGCIPFDTRFAEEREKQKRLRETIESPLEPDLCEAMDADHVEGSAKGDRSD